MRVKKEYKAVTFPTNGPRSVERKLKCLFVDRAPEKTVYHYRYCIRLKSGAGCSHATLEALLDALHRFESLSIEVTDIWLEEVKRIPITIEFE